MMDKASRFGMTLKQMGSSRQREHHDERCKLDELRRRAREASAAHEAREDVRARAEALVWWHQP
eukprot:15675964-Heterocapsa_arctica.AAC.1